MIDYPNITVTNYIYRRVHPYGKGTSEWNSRQDENAEKTFGYLISLKQ